MKKEQRNQRRRAIREQQKRREIEKDRELEAMEDEPEEMDVLETENEDGQVEKDVYLVPSVAEAFAPGPISFTELDELRAAEKEAAAVRHVTWDIQDLVNNILRHPEMDPDEKADAISNAADDFRSRVKAEVVESKKKEQEVEVDVDLLQLEALIAQDHRSTNMAEFLGDMAKTVLSSASRNKLGDEQFAVVRESGGKKERKYPIHDKAHVRNALSRAAQMIKRGGTAATDARAALPKIRAAAKKMGIGADMEKDRNAILVEKGADEKWRWVGWVSNNFLDLDGDIIAESAHKEYVGWLEKNMDVAPAFVSWHTPGTARENPVDFAMAESGFLIMSGVLTEKEAAGLLKAQAKVEMGMSHGTFVFERDPKDPRVVTKYRMYEVSDLPLSRAANPFTDFATIVKEVGMDKLEYLTQIMGEERAKAFIDKAKLKKEQLEAAGVENKETTPEADPGQKTEEPPKDQSKQSEQAAPAPALTDVVAAVVKELDIADLNTFVTQAKESMEKVPVLEAVVKELTDQLAALKGDEEEKLAEKLTPPAARFAWSKENRASASDDTVVNAEEKKKIGEGPGVPDGYWLSAATGTSPIKEE